ncbi:MAG: DUF47 family protein [Ruminococcaceae bacterium]|nr:DUF47 family protein [Oscillospiraceae bacterium]
MEVFMFNKNSANKVHSLIVEHMQAVEECLIKFEGFMDAATTPETVPATLRTLSAGVGAAEDVADKALRRMIDSLGGGTFLASTKEDIIAISTMCDKVANKCETIAKVIVCQKIKLPDEYAKDLTNIIATTRKQFDVLEESIGQFFEKFGALLQDHKILDEIRALESEVDAVEVKLYDDIFALDMDLAHQMQLSNVVELIADISDVIENIADKIQIMLISRKV